MDRKTAIRMLEYSAQAYKNIQSEEKGNRLYVIDDVKSDVRCYVRLNGQKAYITFRGTDSLKDWLTDFQFWKKVVPYNNVNPKIKVHSGFIDAYKSEGVRDKIHNIVTDTGDEITISGHSYGAALAILCAVDLEYNFPEKNYEVFLFGSPRVGNKAFKDSYDKRIFKTFRINNGNDIVTKIPFKLMGYRHVGISVDVGFPRVLGLFSLKNHKPSEYYISILKSYLL